VTSSTTAFSFYIFGSLRDAEQVLRVAESQYDRGRLGVDDIAAATWPAGDQRPATWQERTLGHRPLSGAFWGMFFGIALLLPLLGSRPRQAHGLLDAVGLSDELLDQVTRLVVPGTSALFVVSASPPSGRLGVALTRRAGNMTDTMLDVSQTAGLRHAFGADSGLH
jgi:uncharacterized membrane protein